MSKPAVRYESSQEPLDDVERERWTRKRGIGRNAEEGGPSPDPHLVFRVRLSGEDIRRIEPFAIKAQIGIGQLPAPRCPGMDCAEQAERHLPPMAIWRQRNADVSRIDQLMIHDEAGAMGDTVRRDKEYADDPAADRRLARDRLSGRRASLSARRGRRHRRQRDRPRRARREAGTEPVDEAIDASGMIVTPGFINTHTHLYESPLDKSFVEDMGRRQFYLSGLFEYLPVRSAAMDDEAAHACLAYLDGRAAAHRHHDRDGDRFLRRGGGAPGRPRRHAPLHGARLPLRALVHRRRQRGEVRLGRGGRTARHGARRPLHRGARRRAERPHQGLSLPVAGRHLHRGPAAPLAPGGDQPGRADGAAHLAVGQRVPGDDPPPRRRPPSSGCATSASSGRTSSSATPSSSRPAPGRTGRATTSASWPIPARTSPTASGSSPAAASPWRASPATWRAA